MLAEAMFPWTPVQELASALYSQRPPLAKKELPLVKRTAEFPFQPALTCFTPLVIYFKPAASSHCQRVPSSFRKSARAEAWELPCRTLTWETEPASKL